MILKNTLDQATEVERNLAGILLRNGKRETLMACAVIKDINVAGDGH